MKNTVGIFKANRAEILSLVMSYVKEPLQSQIHAGLTPGPESGFLHSVIIRVLDFLSSKDFLVLAHRTSGIPTNADEVVELAWRLSGALLDRAPLPGKMHYCWPSEPALKALVIMRSTAGAKTLADLIFSPFLLPITGANYIQLGDLSPRPPEPSNR